jgi:UDP:flavonoid glycosyltransferase YjiC (YdhE family)
VHECGFGIRLDTYAHSDEELTGAVRSLLENGTLRERMRSISARLQGAPGTAVAAEAIERLAGGR